MSEEKCKEAITKITKRVREKSAQYPAYDLSSCIEFVQVVDRLGRNQVAEGSLLSELRLGSRSTKSYTGKLSSSRQFGLLHFKAGLLSITDRANLMFYPTEEQEEQKDFQIKKLRIEAFRSPPLYQKLISKFDGKVVPKLETLGNIFMNEYKIAKAVKNSAAKVFVTSATFAGVLGDDNVLQVSRQYESIAGEVPAESEIAETGQKPPPMGQVHSLKLALSSGKSATITVPSDITRADVERLKSLLELLAVEEDTE